MSARRARRHAAALALAIVGLAGLGLASAAQLSINSTGLQAGTATVGTCQPVGQPVAVGFTSAFSGGQYQATQVVVSQVAAACQGRTFRIQVETSTGAAIDLNGGAAGTDVSGTVALTGGSFAATIPSTAVSTIGRVVVLVHS